MRTNREEEPGTKTGRGEKTYRRNPVLEEN
jgi:hypothetical protein